MSARKSRKFAITIWILTASTAALLLIGAQAGLRLNTSLSAPKGLWWVSALAEADIKRGTLVEVCPPDHPTVIALRDGQHLLPGSCALGVATFLKPVAAVAGDLVRIRQGEPVRINGQALAHTTALPQLPAWPDGEYIVEEGTLWLLSGHNDHSFDSRYFGPVPVSHVRAKAVPLLTQGEMAVAGALP